MAQTPEGYKFPVNLSLVDTEIPCIYWRFSYFLTGVNKNIQKTFQQCFGKQKKLPEKSLNSHVDTYVVSVQINFRQVQRQSSLCRAQERKQMIMEKMMNTKTERNTFTKKIGKTVYIVRYYFNEEAKETMQEKINRMLVTEASRQEMQLREVT